MKTALTGDHDKKPECSQKLDKNVKFVKKVITTSLHLENEFRKTFFI